MITALSPIVGPTRGTIAEARAALVGLSKDENDYINELFRLCNLVAFDYRILFAQFLVETADGTSEWWRTRRNPAGIGITGDPAQNAASHTWANGTEAARAHVVHMCAYVFGNVSGTPERQELLPYLKLDPRWNAVIMAKFAGTVTVLGDLGNGKWAVAPDYSQLIAAKANAVFKEEPVTEASVTFGLVPKPTVVNKHLDTTNPWISLASQDRQIEAVIWHRMLGSLNGTDIWFRGGNAATAYGVGVAAEDGTGLAGTVYEWIDPTTRYYGESSGPVDGAYGDGLALVNLVGVNQVNARSEAIEISGNYDTPLDDAARGAIVNLTAWFADQRKIPWDQFPIIPGTTRSFVVWHQEITLGSGKVCPGQVVMDETNTLIASVSSRLKQFQGGTGVVVPPKPTLPIPSVPWDKDATGPHKLGGVTALAMLGQITAKADTAVRSSVGGVVIATMKAGETGEIRGTFRTAAGKRVALVDLGSKGVGRAWLSAFHEKWPTI